ncbi:MAG: MarR family transcriptional regulator [Bacteriovorax sp.]|nr:MarR family transcriptional regulator [Bacteriovorax sp.]
MAKAYKDILKKYAITYPQYLVLMVLWENKNLTVNTIGEILFLDSGTLSPMIKRMEAMKLLTRVRSIEDERVVNVKVTKEAIRLKEKMKDIPYLMLCKTEYSIDEIKKHTQKLKNLRATLVKNSGEQYES